MNSNPTAPPNFTHFPTEIILNIIDHLIACNAKRKTVNRTLLALSRVSQRLSKILAEILIKYNVQHMNSSGLRWAVLHDNQNLVEKLLKNGADITSDKSGRPLSIAVRKGNVDMLDLLLTTANKDQVVVALEQGVNDRGDTVLHRAILLADVSCVNVLLEAGGKPDLQNEKFYRPVDYLYRLPERHGQYDEIIRLLINKHPSEMFKCEAGRTTPLALAVKQKSLEMVSLIINAGLEHCKDGQLAVLINEVGLNNTPLSWICDASEWDCDQERCGQILAIAKLLVMHGADTNKDHVLYHSSPLFLCCSKPRHSTGDTLNMLRLQRDMIHLLLQNGADVNEKRFYIWCNDYSYVMVRFLETAQLYTGFFGYRKPSPKAEEILADSHALFMSEENPILTGRSLYCTSSYMSPEEKDDDDEKSIALKLLQEMFVELLEHVKDVNCCFGQDNRTLLFRTVVIPGAFGLFTTQLLLEKGANIPIKRDITTAYSFAFEHYNSEVCSLLRFWRKHQKQASE